ncbi:N-acetylmuramoyl-L-alanine amidase [Clostridiaceae bacterium NSJ-31]|uniref:N-acetylmuramoyl-L-alanine amidase n=1 Tax=Ligaoa zhengdingensis TaxID=2763658 RepID=A0A926DWZ1_9FIRM|nr:N-acetylmuramoyl-L-alanine amidase [Ligaoa zhengdingensis]MBC8545413.1 N-acetylmuramoyl-L-alanine amidase [Ligaoa zhengdingensis]
MNLIQKKFLLTATVLSFLGLSVAYGVMLEMNQTQPVLMTTPESLPTIVIDAGHGGIDGGAVGVHKEIEKDINLAIATTLNTMLQAGGYPTVMVRNSDISIHDPQYTSVRQQKVSDIKNRLKLAEETPNAIYISIHQNQFEQSQYHGAQMFYSVNNPESQILAETLRMQFKTLLQPENERETKPAQKNLYILHHATCPAVLVECGFLSNPDEASLLATEDYQRQVAFTIYTGLLNYQQNGAAGLMQDDEDVD